MKNLLVFLVFISSNLSINAQYYYMSNISIQQCSNDSSVTLMQLEDWEVFQTENNLWDGDRLPFCYEVTKENYNFYLNIENIDTSKALFFRSIKAIENTEILDPNWVYALGSNGRSNKRHLYDLNRFCEEDLCTGIILGLTIPTEDSLSFTKRIHKLHYTSDFQINACVPTEYFDNQKIEEIVIKLMIDSLENDSLLFIPVKAMELNNYWEPVIGFNSLDIPSNILPNNNEYYLNISDAVFGDDYGWYLGLHDPNIYPKTGNNTFIEVKLEDNTSEQSNINIEFDYFQTLSVQAYTEIIGGLVLNSDSIRHQVTIVQDGNEMCISIVEFTYGTGTTHRYKSGGIFLSSQNACLKYKSGAKLIIDHTELLYGDDNASGMMALEAGSEVHLEGNASLVFNNTLAILSSLDTEYNFIDIYLKRGQSLVFNPSANVIHIGDPKVKVHMLGGKLDISELTEDEKSKFILVYPAPVKELNDNIIVYPNPIQNQIIYSFNSDIEENIDWTITDISGRLIQKGNQNILKGNKEYKIHSIQLNAGIYFLNLISENGIASKKMVNIN